MLIRKHFFTDLRPYVCTFETCDLKIFADRHSWFDHELECHRFEWTCRFCSQPPFATERNLVTHMQSRHPQFTSPVQLPALVEASRQAAGRIPATSFLLCDWDAILRGMNRDAPTGDTLVVTLEQFRRHLGSHMEQLALFALPRGYKDEDDNADSNEAAAMAHSIASSRGETSRDAVSWRSVLTHGAAQDGAVPDMVPDEIPTAPRLVVDESLPNASLYPWSRSRIHFGSPPYSAIGVDPWQVLYTNNNPSPRFGASVNPECADDGGIYLHGGLVNTTTVTRDLYFCEITKTPTAMYALGTTSEGPGPRVGGAALLAGNAFIIFGGDTTMDDSDILDDAL